MNKLSKLALCVAALGLWSCSNEEPANNADNGIAKGDVAYLNVRITSDNATATGRAADYYVNADDQQVKYEYGTGEENNVENAWFYFFDASGHYQLKSNSFTKKQDNTGINNNVAVIGKNTVILEGLSGKNYPTWVITVLNKPAKFQEPIEGLTTLKDFQDMVMTNYRDGQLNEDGEATDGNFVMTTSSFFNDEVNDNTNDGISPYYYATRLNDSNFLTQSPNDKFEEATEDNTVVIYVERLAARVEVNIEKLAENNKAVKLEDGRTIYKLDSTVGGSDNDEEAGVSKTDVYVDLIGWDLVSTAKQSYLMKNLSDWTKDTKFDTEWAWNHSDYHRSYWANAWTYGKDETALKSMLNNTQYYENLKQTFTVGATRGSVVYCRENTNTVENVFHDGVANPKVATTVLIAARLCDKDGNALSIVTFNGVPYYKDSFVLNVLNLAGMKYFYTRTQVDSGTDASGNTVPVYEYNSVDADDVEIVSAASGTTGQVHVQLKNGVTVYTTDGTTTNVTVAEGTIPQLVVTEATTSANSQLKSITTGASNKAIASTDGAVYYPVVIEHLNNPEVAAEGEETKPTAIEGRYGVVRNHLYRINITKISGLGKGIYDPEGKKEEINPETPKDPTYRVESFINVLSWKIVGQDAEI